MFRIEIDTGLIPGSEGVLIDDLQLLCEQVRDQLGNYDYGSSPVSGRIRIESGTTVGHWTLLVDRPDLDMDRGPKEYRQWFDSRDRGKPRWPAPKTSGPEVGP